MKSKLIAVALFSLIASAAFADNVHTGDVNSNNTTNSNNTVLVDLSGSTNIGQYNVTDLSTHYTVNNNVDLAAVGPMVAHFGATAVGITQVATANANGMAAKATATNIAAVDSVTGNTMGYATSALAAGTTQVATANAIHICDGSCTGSSDASATNIAAVASITDSATNAVNSTTSVAVGVTQFATASAMGGATAIAAATNIAGVSSITFH